MERPACWRIAWSGWGSPTGASNWAWSASRPDWLRRRQRRHGARRIWGPGKDPKSAVSLERDLRIMIEGGPQRGVPGGLRVVRRRRRRHPTSRGSAASSRASPAVSASGCGWRSFTPTGSRRVACRARGRTDRAARTVPCADAGSDRPVLGGGRHDGRRADRWTRSSEGAEVVLAGRCADPAIFAPAPCWPGDRRAWRGTRRRASTRDTWPPPRPGRVRRYWPRSPTRPSSSSRPSRGLRLHRRQRGPADHAREPRPVRNPPAVRGPARPSTPATSSSREAG